MTIKDFSIYILSLLLGSSLHAQDFYLSDTVPTGGGHIQMKLSVEIPNGEMFMQSSGMCGSSVSHLSAPEPGIRHSVKSAIGIDGVLTRTVKLIEVQSRGSSESNSQAPANLSDVLSSTSTTYKSSYNPDPSIPTELNIDLGRGRSRLDFSDMSLTKAYIHTAFSDVTITYSSHNLTKMGKMEVHAARAKIILKNPEYSRADLISIRNEMGNTKVILGGNHIEQSTIYIQSGMGGCTLVIDAEQPVKLVVRSGLMAEVEIPASFTAVSKNTYVNDAYETKVEHATTIICNIDFGGLTVMDN